MVLGGLKEGVTPLGWAYAYMTIGNNGDRVSGTLAPRTRRQPRRLHPGHRPGRPHDQGRRQRLDPHPGDLRRNRRRGEEHPRNRRLQRHRHQRPDRRHGPVGQDRHDREQRRRLVLRRGRRRSDRLRLGRLRRLDDADDDPLQRRPGDGRDLPGADLGQRDLRLGGNQGRTRRRSKAKKAAPAANELGSSGEGANPKLRRRHRRPKPKRRRNPKKRRRPKPKPRRNREAAARRSRRRPNRGRPNRAARGGGVTAG